MIIKPDSIPRLILTEEALLRGLSPHHQKRPEIYSNLQKGWAGYRGEQTLGYYLSFLPEKEYYIFHDVRLMIGEKSFQLDFLVLSAYAIFIIESKNLSGYIMYDQNIKRLIRINQDQEDSFPDPIMQAERQLILLQQWMDYFKIKSCPNEYLISIGHATTHLKTNGSNHIFQKILYAEQIPDKILQLNQTFKEKIYTPYLLQKFCDLILESHTPLPINILKKYNISPKEIITGVRCPACNGTPMIRIKNSWYCPRCQHTCRLAHHQAIIDYLLIHGSITNKQAREFLHLTSTNICTRLLESMDLSCTGQRKYKVYTLKK